MRLAVSTIILLLSSCPLSALSDCTETVPVNVRDRQGKLVVGLEPGMFQATVHGQRVKVQSSKVQRGFRRIVLLLDISGSMTETRGTWGMARLIAGDLVSSAGPANSIALMTFSDRIIESTGFSPVTSNLAQRVQALEKADNKLTIHGRKTALLDAIGSAAALFSQSMPGDTIYLVSDGGENQSTIRADEIKKILVNKGIRLFVALLVNNYPATEE